MTFLSRFFCKKLGLDCTEIKPIALKYDLQFEKILNRDDLLNNKQFTEFYNEITPHIKRNAAKEYKNFLTYFGSLNCTREIQVVDIGWRCTMQSCLKKLLPEYEFYGYYLGIREDANISPNKDALGFFLNGENDTRKKCFLAEVTALIEMFFSAPHGSVEAYSDNGNINYCMYEGESDVKYKKYIENIQEGALRFIADFDSFRLSDLIEISPEKIFIGLNQLNINTKTADLIKIGDFCFNSGVKNTPIARPDHIYKYIFNPRKFLYDFSYSMWKIGFLKRVLKVKFPYKKIFSWIYKNK